MNNILRPALVTFTVLTLVTGVAYPMLVTGIGQAMFPKEAAGSLIQRDGKTVGSAFWRVITVISLSQTTRSKCEARLLRASE